MSITQHTDSFVLPDGSRYTVVSSPANPQRQPLIMEMIYQPGCIAPPPHIHPNASDTFEVLEGAIEVRANGKWHRLETGQSITAEPGHVHTFRNRGPEPVHVRNIHAPAHGFERYIRRIDRLLAVHGFTKITPRAAIYLAMLDREHTDTQRPAPQLGAPMAILAALGRALRLQLPD
jgi:quercetin dioxygenase-like cupin family protein